MYLHKYNKYSFWWDWVATSNSSSVFFIRMTHMRSIKLFFVWKRQDTHLLMMKMTKKQLMHWTDLKLYFTQPMWVGLSDDVFLALDEIYNYNKNHNKTKLFQIIKCFSIEFEFCWNWVHYHRCRFFLLFIGNFSRWEELLTTFLMLDKKK